MIVDKVTQRGVGWGGSVIPLTITLMERATRFSQRCSITEKELISVTV
jgi:hypothetical protein